MKLQCSCGAKYAFDAKPEMLSQPVKFICPGCGLDSSDFVNELIRHEFGGLVPPPPPPPPPPASRLKISHEAAPAAAPAEAPVASKFCAKHRERVTEKCGVCQKPICPKCLEMFGYFCSPLCKGKAEAQNLDVPVYAGRKDLVEAKFWRKTGLIAGVAGLIIAAMVGGWIWYAWFGTVPHPYFSVRFEDGDRGYFGRAELTDKEQVVFLHGGTLARYDFKTQKPVWSQELISKEQIAAAIKLANEEEARMNEGMGMHHHTSAEDIARSATQGLQSELSLHVSGQNIWVEKRGTLTRYDWDSGKVAREVPVPDGEGELVERDGELQMIGSGSVTHISLASGDFRVEQIGPAAAKVQNVAQTVAQRNSATGLSGAASGQPLDPKQVEAQAQNLKLQGKLALPALLSNARHTQQIDNALRDDPQNSRPNDPQSAPTNVVSIQLIAGATGSVQFSTRLLESRLVSHSAMKAAPKKSALDGEVNASKTGQIANELLNEMQRNAGGDTVTEDESRYQVTVHLLDAAGAADWTGEVIGIPEVFVLKTVNVIAAGKTVIVLDKANKKLWTASLTYPVSVGEGGAGFSREPSAYGEGPCVERDGTLYVIDQAVLSAFELNSGNARWRLPSVGVAGLFFDDQNNVYVNTTSGNPDDVKYSRQIDISRHTQSIFAKVEAKTGKTLWSIKPGGFVSYVSGKFIYSLESYDPNPSDADDLGDQTLSLQKTAYLRITRIRPSDGKIMWEYHDSNRCPVYTHFDGNTIELVFKREVQVLRYLTF